MSEEKRRPVRRGETPERTRSDEETDRNILGIIAEVEEKLASSVFSESLTDLNSFERKLIHRHFDHKSEYETRTYRNGEKHTLCIYPTGNIERFAQEKAQAAMDTGESIELPPMGSYARYMIHNALKDITGVETRSEGEGNERHVQIVSKSFGRGLKKIAKKIRLF